jgi:hypothetical protein
LGKKTSKTSSTSTPWQPAQPILLGAGQDITDTVKENSGNLQQLSSNLNGMLPGLQSMAMDTSSLNPAFHYTSDVLSGKYLGQQNPYMQGMIDQTGQDVGNKVNATFSAAGRSAGGANQQLLSKGLADSENALRYNDYNNERNQMTQAAGMLPSLQASKFSGVQPLLGATQLAGQLPYYGTNALGNIGGLYSGYGKQTGTQPGGWGNDVANAAISALPFVLSDHRAKENIHFVGKLENGLGLYEFDYKPEVGIEGRWRGVMAQEVKAKMPWMLGPTVNGYMTVKFQPARIA